MTKFLLNSFFLYPSSVILLAVLFSVANNEVILYLLYWDVANNCELRVLQHRKQYVSLYCTRRLKAHISRLAFAFVVIVLEIAIVCHII